MKICLDCKVDISAKNSNALRCDPCDYRHNLELGRQRAKAKRIAAAALPKPPAPARTRICADCDFEIEPSRPAGAKYCVSCLEIHQAINKANEYASRKAYAITGSRIERRRSRKCRTCGKPLRGGREARDGRENHCNDACYYRAFQHYPRHGWGNYRQEGLR